MMKKKIGLAAILLATMMIAVPMTADAGFNIGGVLNKIPGVSVDKGKTPSVPSKTGGGTNGAKVNETYAVPAIVIGIPVRYIHSSNCWAALDDYQNAVKLAVELTKILSQETVAAL